MYNTKAIHVVLYGSETTWARIIQNHSRRYEILEINRKIHIV
jgi:hypothetical protein